MKPMKGHGRITRPKKKKKKKEETGNLPKKEKNLQSNDSKDDAKLGNKMEMQINKMEAQIQKTKEMLARTQKKSRIDNQQITITKTLKLKNILEGIINRITEAEE